MIENKRKPAPLALKPDLEEAAKRWNAFFVGEIIDRPVVCVTAPRSKSKPAWAPTYRQMAFNDLNQYIEQAIANVEATFWGGEAIPGIGISFGPHEIAVFTGAELRWSDDSGDTNWAVPYVENWERSLPIRLQDNNPFWLRMQDFYRRAIVRTAGKMLLGMPDLHTNMDLIAAIRGPQRLCMDLFDQPEMIDRAMTDARAIFPQLWNTLRKLGRMDEFGSTLGYTQLACDFSALIGPAMFRRWVLPALEEEAQIVKNAVFHWDGPGALVHTKDIISSRGLHAVSYVPGHNEGRNSIDHLELHQRVQAGGKAVQVSGTPEEIKSMHRKLRPEKTLYIVTVETPQEAEQLLDWFVKNT